MTNDNRAHATKWNDRYATGSTPWDSGEPSRELVRLLDEWKLPPCRMLELGCGTGTNAVYLSQQGFDVTACDISPLALERARAKAAAAGVDIDYRHADLVADAGGFAIKGCEPFPFVFDRGVYHTVRQDDLGAFLRNLTMLTANGTWYWLLAGNADDIKTDDGPPRISATTMLAELESLFELHALRRFCFHGVEFEGERSGPLAWSAVFRRR